MNKTTKYTGFKSGKAENQVQTKQSAKKKLGLNDQNPSYDSLGETITDRFGNRLKEAVDEDRYLLDQESVAIIALKIGLCIIEDTEEDAIDLRNNIWLKYGKQDKLKEELIKEMKKELSAYNLNGLEKFTAPEILEFYRKINSCRE